MSFQQENKSMYNLFLDDERWPAKFDLSWQVARNVDDAIYLVKTLGMPRLISFDHDLGAHKFTGMDFAKWLVNHLMDTAVAQEDYPMFYVHSMNPVGAENIRSYLQNFYDG